MFGLGRRSRDELHEARIVDLKEAHEARVRELLKLADMLAEQVEYLRAQLGRPFIAAQSKGLNPTAQPLAIHGVDDFPLHMGEAEEDARALHEEGHIDSYELAAQLEQIQRLAGLSDLSIDPDQ